MEKELMYAKAMKLLEEMYVRCKRFKEKDEFNLFMFVYNEISSYVSFMYSLDLIDYDEYCRLKDEHSKFFNVRILCIYLKSTLVRSISGHKSRWQN